MSHTRNGTRTRVVPALTAIGITILDGSTAQRQKENSLVACTQAVGWSKKPEFGMRSPSWICAVRSGPG